MSFTLVIKPEAIKETAEIYAYYKEIDQRLADRFERGLDTVYREIQRRPERYAIRKKNYRHLQLKKFPYRVVYALIGQEVVVFKSGIPAAGPARNTGHRDSDRSTLIGRLKGSMPQQWCPAKAWAGIS